MPLTRLQQRTAWFDLHTKLFGHAIASSELAEGGDRAYPVDRPPPT